MTELQFQVIIFIASIVGSLTILLLGIIAYFVRQTHLNVLNRLNSHSTKHDAQKDWNAETDATLSRHGEYIRITEKDQEQRTQEIITMRQELHQFNLNAMKLLENLRKK